MSRTKLATLILTLLSACGPGASANDGSSLPKAAIDWTAHDLSDGVDEQLTGPGGKLRLRYSGEKVRIERSQGGSLNLDVIPPASIRWRPDGGAVAINNGNGSGQMSDLSIVLNGNPPILLRGVQDDLKRYFIAETKCPTDFKNISVGAEGWSSDGSVLWVDLEYWDREKFCDPDISLAGYNIAARKVVSHFSADQVLARFCPDPGFRQAGVRNCARGY